MTRKLLQVLAGEAVWPPPVWLMRQAGRYLPEYRATKAQAGSFIDLCLTPALATEVTLQPIRRFGFDASILFSDILMLPHALGQKLDYVHGEGPVLEPVRDAVGLAKLDRKQVASITAPIFEAVERIRAALPADTALIGFAGSPWTVLCYMVEGRGSRDFASVRGLAYSDPALFAALLDLVTDCTVDYLIAQIEAGADTVMLFDTWAGILPPGQFRRFVIEPARRIAAAIQAHRPGYPVMGFPRMAGAMLGEYAAVTGVQGVGVDTAADPLKAAAMVPDTVALQGNLDPLALLAGGEPMRDGTQAVLDAWRGRPFVFNLGHGIVKETPPDHVTALVRMVQDA